jgi:hypothetical protein
MPAWWDSVDAVTSFTWWVRWLAFGFTILAAICGGLVLIGTRRGDTLKAERDAEGRAAAAKAEKALAELEAKTRDRHLTPGLADALTMIARKHGPQGLILIERSGSNEEARKLADLINFGLGFGGWKIQRQRVSLISGNPTYGLVCIFAGRRQTPVANDLVAILRDKGLRVETQEAASQPEAIILEVGLKP